MKEPKKELNPISPLKLREFQVDATPPDSEHKSSSSSFKILELEASSSSSFGQRTDVK